MNVDEFIRVYIGQKIVLKNFSGPIGSTKLKHSRPHKPRSGEPPMTLDQLQAIEELGLRRIAQNLLLVKAIGRVKPIFNLNMAEAESVLEIGKTFMDSNPWAHHEGESMTNKQRAKLHQLKDAKGAAFISLRLTEVLGLGHEPVAFGSLTRAQASKLIARIAFL